MLPGLQLHRKLHVVAAASRKRGQTSSRTNKKSGRQGHTKTPKRQPSTTQSDVGALAGFKVDEHLLFQENKPSHASSTPVNIVYAYPNEYTVGICSLGYQLVWAFFATQPHIDVVRLFTDARDELPRSWGGRMDLMGFSFSWELDYRNILTLLEAANLPLLATERDPSAPLVFGGGPVLTANPEPYALFFDVVLLGDGEDLLRTFVDAYAATGGVAACTTDAQRTQLLTALAQVPGVYVPRLYDVCYDGHEGHITSIQPLHSGVPRVVDKQTYKGPSLARSTVVTPRMAWESIYMVEVVRSCPEMCRFCLASYASLPFRAPPVEETLIPAIEAGLAITDRIGLLGASVTQHPQFEELLRFMMDPARSHVRMSIASVRTNTVTQRLAAALAARGTRSLTVAVESGSARMRRVVNKKLQQEEIEECVVNAEAGGLEGLKLYGMVGVPGEGDDDVHATIDMMTTLANLIASQLRAKAPGLKLTLGCSTFVPKSHTPFQWAGVDKAADARLLTLDKAMGKLGVQFRPESYKWSLVQALLSRGDRRLTPLLLLVRSYGDSLGSFRRAFKELRGTLPPMEYYVHASYQVGSTVLPWQHLHGPLPEATLVQHWQSAEREMMSNT